MSFDWNPSLVVYFTLRFRGGIVGKVQKDDRINYTACAQCKQCVVMYSLVKGVAAPFLYRALLFQRVVPSPTYLLAASL